MPNRQFLLKVLSIAVLLQSCIGCVSLYRHKPIDVLVIDAETCAPVENALIEVGYHRGVLMIDGLSALSINKPPDRSITTDKSGKGTIPVANFDYSTWTISARDYHKRSGGNIFAGRARIPDGLKRSTNENGDHVVVQLYRDPIPTYTIVIPGGYQGPILVKELEFENGVQAKVGEREFIYRPNEHGYVEVRTIPFVNHPCVLLDVAFRDENGAEIPQDNLETPADKVVLRYVTLGIYVLGTQTDHDAIHRRVFNYIDGDPSHISTNHDAVALLFDQSKSENSR